MKKTVLFISVFFLSLISYFLFLPPAHAISQIPQAQSNNTVQPNTNPDVPNNLHNWTQSVMIEVMSSLTCQIAGVDPINPKQSCLGADQKTGKIGFLPSPQTGGAIGFMGNMISMLYTPPLHTGDYFQNLAQNFGITKKTYAAADGGTGFQSLVPLIGIWTTFRNLVYLLLVIVFVVIGLAIMLRLKIDPRTVMTIQNQIPKIIVGILAVTFSFAIAGFLIDMMWILIYFSINILSQADPNIADDVYKIAQSTSPFDAAEKSFHIGNILSTTASTIGEGFLSPIFESTPGRIIMGGFVGVLMGIVGNNFALIVQSLGGLIPGAMGANLILAIAKLGNLTSLATSLITAGVTAGSATVGFGIGFAFAPKLAEFLGSIIVWLIISIAMLVALFKLWFSLLSAYVSLLVHIVLAPLFIIAGIIPGSSYSFSGWFRSMAVNLLVFPVVIFMFLLGKIFFDVFTTAKGVFIPPLIGDPVSTAGFGDLIGLGIILLTPHVVDLLKEQFKSPKSNVGALIRAGYSAGSPNTAFNKAGQIALSTTSIKSGVGMLPIVGKMFKDK